MSEGDRSAWALSAVIASAAAVLWVLAVPSYLPLVHLPWAAVLLLVAFAAAESALVSLWHGAETQSFSLSELPLVVGLYTLFPPVLLAARLVGSAVALIRLRTPRVKCAFNLALFALETAIFLIVWRAIAGGDPLGPSGWVGVFIAALVVDAVAAVAVAAAIRLRSGPQPAGALREELRFGAGLAVANAGFGVAAVIVLSVDWRALWVLLLCAAVLGMAHYAHQALRRHHDSLRRFNDLAVALVGPNDLDAVAAVVLAQVREHLRANAAALVWTGGGQRWSLPRDTGFEERLASDARAMRKDPDLLVAALPGDAGPAGWLAVGGPRGDLASFGRDDARLLRAFAGYAGAKMRNAELTDHLSLQVRVNEHQALHDALTGLPNRRLFDKALHGSRRDLAVLLLDLDRFKEVNDTLGHTTGDVLLAQVARRLEQHVSMACCIARLGGDEFAIAVELETAAQDEGLRLAARVRDALSEPFDVGDISLSIDASIGVTTASGSTDSDTLLKEADVAMYAAKTSRSGIRAYAETTDDSSTDRLKLPAELRRAIKAGDLVVHYQPQAHLETGDVCSVEALARWSHPTRGTVPPSEFIDVAEQTGLIVSLTHAVLNAALDQCRQWRATGRNLSVAVNLSPRVLHDEGFPDRLAVTLADTGMPADALTLEITENHLMADVTRMVAVLDRLATMGVVLSVDDLGTGYSSLAYLKRLPIDEVKIDRSFVSALATDRDDEAIVEAIIALGQRLGMRVVAEGVEDAATYGRLRAMGCDVAQGYWLSRPLPAEELDSWFFERATLAASAG